MSWAQRQGNRLETVTDNQHGQPVKRILLSLAICLASALAFAMAVLVFLHLEAGRR
jgi:hypothetical protein